MNGVKYDLQPSKIQAFVESLRFNSISAIFILSNAVAIGVEIDTGRIDMPINDRIGWFGIRCSFQCFISQVRGAECFNGWVHD